jgi:glycerophosphoryl diester phosphodiesterase
MRDGPAVAGHRNPRPRVIAERGAAGAAPENTIAAFELAAALGADAISLDVHLSRDDHPVVIRDFGLERTTDGRGSVRDRTMRELKRLDAGAWRGDRFRGQRIQTLQEVLERFRDRLDFWIELRAGSDRYPDIEDRVVTLLEIYDVRERAVIQSFDHAALAQIRGMQREIRLSGIVHPGPIDVDGAVRAGWHGVCAGSHLLSAETAAALERAGVACYAWTDDEPAHVDRLVKMGVTGLFTDRPDRLRERLARSADRA